MKEINRPIFHSHQQIELRYKFSHWRKPPWIALFTIEACSPQNGENDRLARLTNMAILAKGASRECVRAITVNDIESWKLFRDQQKTFIESPLKDQWLLMFPELWNGSPNEFLAKINEFVSEGESVFAALKRRSPNED